METEVCNHCFNGYDYLGDPCFYCHTTRCLYEIPMDTLYDICSDFSDKEIYPVLRLAARIAMGKERHGTIDYNERNWMREIGNECADAHVYNSWDAYDSIFEQ